MLTYFNSVRVRAMGRRKGSRYKRSFARTVRKARSELRVFFSVKDFFAFVSIENYAVGKTTLGLD